MKHITRLLLSLGFTVILAMLLSFVPGLFHPEPIIKDASSGVNLPYGTALDDRNLVDYMSRMKLHLDLQGLDWGGAILYVDMKLGSDRVMREDIFKDMQELCYFGLAQMNNVNKVMIRIYNAGQGRSNELILALSAKRNAAINWAVVRSGAEALMDDETFVRSVFQVYETPLWLDSFGKTLES